MAAEAAAAPACTRGVCRAYVCRRRVAGNAGKRAGRTLRFRRRYWHHGPGCGLPAARRAWPTVRPPQGEPAAAHRDTGTRTHHTDTRDDQGGCFGAPGARAGSVGRGEAVLLQRIWRSHRSMNVTAMVSIDSVYRPLQRTLKRPRPRSCDAPASSAQVKAFRAPRALCCTAAADGQEIDPGPGHGLPGSGPV